MLYKIPKEKLERIFFWVVMAILLTGIVVRVCVFLQNRNLFIDEANVARNLYERGLAGFLHPLDYEQYAPPLFLWIEKLLVSTFGYSEYVLRVYLLLCGIGALIVFIAILKQITGYRSLWYPLGMFVVAFILIRYSSELKQYMSDVFVTLSIILFALKIKIQEEPRKQFFVKWALIGGLSVLLCMPSVFILAGVACYYLYQTIENKNYKQLWPLAFAGLVWLGAFGFYYWTLLQYQIGLKYLQPGHTPYYLYLIPHNREEFIHNWDVFKEKLMEAAGYDYYTREFNQVLLVIGIGRFIWKERAIGLLILVPIICTLVASGLHIFSMMPRLALFFMPLLLLVIGYGMYALMNIQFVVMQAILVIWGFHCIYDHSMLRMMWDRYEFEEITDSFEFMQKHNVKGEELYLHHGAVPAYIYYTEIHPKKDRWASLKNAHRLRWEDSYTTLGDTVQNGMALICTSISTEDIQSIKERLGKHMILTDSLEQEHGRRYAYIYAKRK